MEFSSHAKLVLNERRYLAPGETPEGMFARVAKQVALVEAKDRAYWEEQFFNIMNNGLFLPNTPCLFNAGISNLMSACFVLVPDDSIPSIFDVLGLSASIFQSGGGLGYSFSRLRENGARVKSGGISSGPISFMGAYNEMAESIKQGGRRRGAMMGVLNCSHPDIVEFIRAKETEGRLRNFNLSVDISQAFIKALKAGDSYPLYHYNGRGVIQPKGEKSAKEIFDLICQGIHKNGEPGVIFLDEINDINPLPEHIEACNACSEAYLLSHEACILGSINLARFVGGSAELFYDAVTVAHRFLDNLIDAQEYIHPTIEEAVKKTRKIGLGIMGLHEALILNHIPYDSEAALKFTHETLSTFDAALHKASSTVGEEKGFYPAHTKVRQGTQFDRFRYRRNMWASCIAPTGSLSILAGTSSGLEPLFILYGTKRYNDEKVEFTFPPFERWLVGKPVKAAKDIMDWAKLYGHVDDCPHMTPHERALWKRGASIPWQAHLKMLEEAQGHIDMGISKTINIHHNASIQDVEQIFRAAMDSNVRSLTIYRENSREAQVFDAGKSKPKEAEEKNDNAFVIRKGQTGEAESGCGKVYITYNQEPKTETFIRMGKAGACQSAWAEITGRATSLALQAGVPLREIIKQYQRVKCPRPIYHGGEQYTSCIDCMARILNAMSGEVIECGEDTSQSCPECGQALMREGQCWRCTSCSYSTCGG
ncbi:MAG: Ribonucleoside-diphosphate reductase [Candidatus Gottesmanbacteria bacterium GW2011_GWB1_49_7]|uniref:Vitamin B12-dependent ribonucleotide reductase n=1 Tax=Candidatus Gottesmanbacteria bacterium GW2011_GWB1_49_7 TaxID=1618448 RepID=A0A0G1YDN5_9BACT|nr:MAG: Ribonucleoside-diphosphate reductase [Candidatus Gottesmanbacteria bacterium GW2011_GWB1_49_7]